LQSVNSQVDNYFVVMQMTWR